MPIFTYQCKSCLEKFDILVGMTQDKPELKCPKCKSSDLEKQFAPFRVSGVSEKSSSSKCSSCSGGDCSGCH
jgi:putative FmdB family regulatory protein